MNDRPEYPASPWQSGATKTRDPKSISGWWYVLALFFPAAGFITGIVFMAKSKIGPAFALWATACVGIVLNVAVMVL